MIGRSNLQQAVPVTFGYKIAGLLSAIERHRDRLAELRDMAVDTEPQMVEDDPAGQRVTVGVQAS